MTLPFENDTGGIIRKVASAQLKHDKLKKGLSVFAIALAAFLMTAVLLLTSGIAAVNKNGGNSITGSYHALVSGITQEQYKNLSSDRRIRSLGFNAPVKSVRMGDKTLNVSCSNEDSLTLNGLSLSKGKMPEEKNEIVIEEEFLLSQKMNAEIGETISLPIEGTRGTTDFVISGYLKTAAKGTERTLYAAIVSMKYFEFMDGWNTCSASAMFRINMDGADIYEDIKTTAEQISKDAQIEQLPSINKAFIELSRPSVFTIAVAAAGLVIVIMAGILVIYSIFYISIINSIKEYGQLRTIGMTTKQIKRLVMKEGTSLTLAGVPIGLAAGVLLSYLLIPQGFRLNQVFWVCPVVAVLVYITVRLSIRKPARTAATVSPIEASRCEMGDSAVHMRKYKKLTLFSLARFQILRYKKKNLLTIASLVLTGVLLLGLSSVLSSVDAREMSLSGFESGQFFVRISDEELRDTALELVQKDSPFTKEVYDALRHLSGVTKVTAYQELPVSRDLQSQESDNAVVGFGQEDMELIQSCAAVGRIPDYETMASKNQLIVGRADDFEEYFNTKPKAGAFVTIKVFDGEHSRDMQFEIAAVLDQSKIGNNGDKIDMILLPLDAMNKIAQSNLTYQYAVSVEESYEQQAEKEIRQFITGSPRLYVSSLSDAVAQNENFLQGTKLALAVAIVLIGCFSVMNLLNTVLTGIIVRRREFALMRSVGMSQKQLSAMVYWEGMLIVSVGLVFSLAIGGGVGYMLCSFLKSSFMTYMNYHFPVSVTVIYCLIVLACTAVITGTALKQQSKWSLIELLRK